MSVTDDGERVYVAGTTAGFYVLDSEAIAHHTDAELAAGTAGCNQRSTIVVGRRRDRCRRSLPAIANDCVHMVVNNDPGLKAFLASNASAQAKAERYLVLLTRSRFDVYPPINATPTGTHSAVFVPDRPAQVKGNTKNRPAYVWLTDENGGCPLNYARMVSVESEIDADHGRRVRDSRQSDRRVPRAGEHRAERPAAGGAWRSRITIRRCSRISSSTPGTATACARSTSRRPQMPREVGYAMTVPQGIARTYPVFKDGLIYWVDNDTGLHVARYTGPAGDELPGPGSGVYEGNATSPHR